MRNYRIADIFKCFKNNFVSSQTRQSFSNQTASTSDPANNEFVPQGHFYSAVPDFQKTLNEWPTNVEKLSSNAVHGVTLCEEEQLKLLHQLKIFYDEISFTNKKSNNFRYYYDNSSYSYADAIFLHCMMRFLKPNKIIEVGSGFSSAMMLDTNQFYLDDTADITFIEPYPELLQSLLTNKDKSSTRLIAKPLQDVQLREFEKLQKNDILFIDSTHVSKINSDVNRLIFEILPILSSGVYIHIHDIFYPFEYPKHWIEEHRAWNESYILRAFLQYNEQFKIVLFSDYMMHFHESFFREEMPLCLENTGGCIWLVKK